MPNDWPIDAVISSLLLATEEDVQARKDAELRQTSNAAWFT
jgi:hypothetical protein